MRSIVVVSSAIVGVFLLSLPAVAQQKTVRACQAEWRANKDANQAKGITEKAYVTQCRAAAPATTTMAPAGASTGGRRTKDSQGLPGGMARQQGRQSGEGHNAKSLRRAVPYRRYGCGACSGTRTGTRTCTCTDKNDGTCTSSVGTAAGHHSCPTGRDDTDGCEPIYDGRPGQNAMPDRHRRLGQYEFKDLSLHRLQGLRQHENRRVYVRD